MGHIEWKFAADFLSRKIVVFTPSGRNESSFKDGFFIDTYGSNVVNGKPPLIIKSFNGHFQVFLFKRKLNFKLIFKANLKSLPNEQGSNCCYNKSQSFQE